MRRRLAEVAAVTLSPATLVAATLYWSPPADASICGNLVNDCTDPIEPSDYCLRSALLPQTATGLGEAFNAGRPSLSLDIPVHLTYRWDCALLEGSRPPQEVTSDVEPMALEQRWDRCAHEAQV
jgi:hypothetical protein